MAVTEDRASDISPTRFLNSKATYSRHRLFLFLQFKQAICVLFTFDVSSS
jgi:hypothetical protein